MLQLMNTITDKEDWHIKVCRALSMVLDFERFTDSGLFLLGADFRR
jgi:hypothetical protein